MPTSKEDLRDWFDCGVENKATHLIVVCDTFDYEDYPSYVQKGDDAKAMADYHNSQNMQRVMEVYDLSMDREKQIQQYRAFNY